MSLTGKPMHRKQLMALFQRAPLVCQCAANIILS